MRITPAYMEVKVYQGLTYVVKYPSNYKAGQKYPVIFFMHGAGSRGTDVEVLKDNPYFKNIEKYENFPFISVAPQCHANTWFDLFQTLQTFICHICQQEFADRERIYMIGASMGGYATWQLAMSMPELFAAIVPICGGGMYWNAARLKNVPVWAFHGDSDPVVYPEESKKMVDGVNKNGGNAKLTIYPDCLHNSWDATYSNYEVFRWMLEHTNREAAELEDKYKGSAIYG